MAHRTEKEETEFKVVPSDTITLCVNCGGVAGNSATNSMCQKCFSASATSAGGANPVKHAFGEKTARSTRRSPERSLGTSSDLKDETESSPPAKRVLNRCSGCRRKVGLTGFRCRCGELFCADHRYSDRHECSYDYKTAGREAIARENPVVRAAKIVKI